MDELDRLTLASPCSESWSQMQGDDRARFCRRCCLTVYNVADLSRTEAKALIGRREGRLCVRWVRRLDGTVLTRDCKGGYAFHLREQLHKRQAQRWWSSPVLYALTVMACAVIALVTLFGDNLKALFGMAPMGALAGDTVVERRRPSNSHDPRASLRNFPSPPGNSTY